MNFEEQERLEQLLRKCLPPTALRKEAGPKRDLWPEVLRRLDERTPALSLLDWALLAAVLALLASAPAVIPMFLYQL